MVGIQLTTLVDLGVPENLLDGLEGVAEQIAAQLLETSTGENRHEINTLRRGNRSQWWSALPRRGCAWHARKPSVNDGEHEG
jgi:hypothetical protein